MLTSAWAKPADEAIHFLTAGRGSPGTKRVCGTLFLPRARSVMILLRVPLAIYTAMPDRSEERRVGKECTSRGSADHQKHTRTQTQYERARSRARSNIASSGK